MAKLLAVCIFSSEAYSLPGVQCKSNHKLCKFIKFKIWIHEDITGDPQQEDIALVKEVPNHQSQLTASFLCMVLTTCPLGWTEFKGECLYFSHDRLPWTDAEASCRNKHNMGYLATVDTSDKQTYINMFASVLHHFRESTFWLGSSDFAIEGSWRWVETGTGFTGYTNWATGFPDGNRTHNCLLMKYIGNTPQWVDYNCNSKSYYICETPSTSNVIIG